MATSGPSDDDIVDAVRALFAANETTDAAGPEPAGWQLDDQCLRPEQIAPSRRLTVEQRLVLHVLWLALWDLQSKDSAIRGEALRYFNERPHLPPQKSPLIRCFDFEYACEQFDLDCGAVRASLTRLRLVANRGTSWAAKQRRRGLRPDYRGERKRRLIG